VECTSGTFGSTRIVAELCDERGWRPDDVLTALAGEWLEQTRTADLSAEVDAGEHAETSVSRA
jgi:hypothetical protein